MSFDEVKKSDYIEAEIINKKGDRNLDGMILQGLVVEIEQCKNSSGQWVQIKLDSDWRIHKKDHIRIHLKASDFRLFMDGDQWCAVYSDFVDLQTSSAGFGETKGEAIRDLIRQKV